MSKIIPFARPRVGYNDLREEVREEMRNQACVWLARLDAGATEADITAIGEWLDADASHLEALLEMAELWDQSSVLQELSRVFPLTQYRPLPARRIGRRELLATAALLLVGIGGLGGTVAHISGTRKAAEQEASLVSAGSWETRIGEQLTIDLPDGSRVILNTNTALRSVFNGAERHIFLLRGEGHFTVAKDTGRPFRVHAGSRVVEATGTAFAVQFTQQAEVGVTVTEGSVNFMLLDTPAPAPGAGGDNVPALRDVSTSLPLVAGEYAIVAEAATAIEKVAMGSEDIEVKLAWRHGMLLFRDDPLAVILAEFGRYTPIRIEADPAITDKRFSSFLQAGNVESLLSMIRQNADFDVEIERVGTDLILIRVL